MSLMAMMILLFVTTCLIFLLLCNWWWFFLVLNLVVSCEETHLKMLGLDYDKRENERKNGWWSQLFKWQAQSPESSICLPPLLEDWTTARSQVIFKWVASTNWFHNCCFLEPVNGWLMVMIFLVRHSSFANWNTLWDFPVIFSLQLQLCCQWLLQNDEDYECACGSKVQNDVLLHPDSAVSLLFHSFIVHLSVEHFNVSIKQSLSLHCVFHMTVFPPNGIMWFTLFNNS